MSDFFDLGNLVGRINGIKADERDGAMQGGLVAGEHVLGVSNTMVPHEDGDLERTGGVSQANTSQGVVTAISYKDADYAGQAVDQHEDMSLQHDAGRNAKFLELALAQTRDEVAGIITQAIRRRLGN